MSGKIRDLTNLRFGKLTALKIVGKTSRNNIIWECICDCGDIHKASSNHLVNGHTKSCGCLKIKYQPKEASARNIYNSYNYDGYLSFDYFLQICQSNCFYCGIKPLNRAVLYKQKGRDENRIKESEFFYNGLDRIDNNKGYEKDNIVPCCSYCNTMKLNKTREEFYKQIELIYNKYLMDKQK